MVRMPPDLADRTPYQNIIYEKDPEDDRLVRITLNRPEEMNALSYPMLMDLRHALISAERDPAVKVIIVKGAGRAFSAGYDLEASYDLQGVSPPSFMLSVSFFIMSPTTYKAFIFSTLTISLGPLYRSSLSSTSLQLSHRFLSRLSDGHGYLVF